MPNTIKLDDFDLRLLQAVQENNLLTAQELADRVHLSPVSCLRRLKRLRQHKVITKDISVLDPARVGLPLQMMVLVSLERERADIISEFKRAVVKMKEVTQCYYVTGDVDFVMLISAASMAEYDAFTQRFFFENKNLRRFSTLVVMNQVKYGAPLPLSEPS